LLAASAAEAPVSPLPAEACAAPDVRPAEESADAEPVGSGSAGADYFPDEQVRDDCSAGPQADDSPQAGWAEDGSAALQEDDLFPVDCSALLFPVDHLADSLPDDCSVVPARADSTVGMDDSAEPDSPQRAARSEQADCLADSSAGLRALRFDPAAQRSAGCQADPHSV